jgi:hypothetical protein
LLTCCAGLLACWLATGLPTYWLAGMLACWHASLAC